MKPNDATKGKFVKILFREGNSIRSIRGNLISAFDGFIGIRTMKQDFYIGRPYIVKIQDARSDPTEKEGADHGE